MMKELTTKERMLRVINRQEADRIPITDSPWRGTISRWEREGMPKGIDFRDYFGLDKFQSIGVDSSPQYEEKTIEETDEYIIYTTSYGATLKQLKLEDATPEFLDFKICTFKDWVEAKKRMVPTEDRINWNYLKENYDQWVAEGRWIQAGFWFGFDVTHSWAVGTETLLMAMIDEPEWVKDMFDHYLEMNIALFDKVWDAGYKFDSIFWPDDMGYKNTPFFSTTMYRELLKPYHKKAIDWAHNKGIKAHLHSCGYIYPLLDDLIEIGVDILNPLEVKAGMNPCLIKEKYGEKLTLHGGINAQIWDKKDEIQAELRRVIPIVKANGGYIFSSDHSVPNSVSLQDFTEIIATVKDLGKY